MQFSDAKAISPKSFQYAKANLFSLHYEKVYKNIFKSVRHFRSRTRSELLCGQNYSFAICASKIFAQLLIECRNTNYCQRTARLGTICNFAHHIYQPPLFFFLFISVISELDSAYNEYYYSTHYN